MRKRKIYTSIACALLCASTLTACAGIDYTVPLTDYWYDHYATTPEVVEETLVYKVTFEASSSLSKQEWSVSYNEGTYTTHLTKNKDNGTFVYETLLEISGKYSYGVDASHEFTDVVKSTVIFNDKSKAPIYSVKEVLSTSPVNNPTAEYYYAETQNKVETTYEADLSKGTCVVTDLKNNTSSTSTFEIDDKYTYLDNEQLLFALRGLNQKSSPSFYVYAPFSRKVQTVQATFNTLKTDETFSFTMAGEEDATQLKAIPFYPITLGIDDKHSGAPQTIWLAEMSNPQKNTYRNVILQMSVTIAYNVGTFTYSLVNADFID